MDKQVICSLTTIPSRFEMLKVNLPSILVEQTFKVDKLIIALDDCFGDDVYERYEALKDEYPKIEIIKCEKRWRSCNKLLPTLKLYPDSVVITTDDDHYLPPKCFETLVKEYETHPNCIIAQECNPLVIEDGKIKFLNSFDVMLKQVEFAKYLSNCCLFPPHTFDGTDLYDWDKMNYITGNLDDELWFMINSTLNGVQCIGLNYVHSLEPEVKIAHKDGDYTLTDSNKQQEFINLKCDRMNELYGERMLEQIKKKNNVFTITNDNVYSFLYLFPYIKMLYGERAEVVFADDITKSWKQLVLDCIKDGRYRI